MNALRSAFNSPQWRQQFAQHLNLQESQVNISQSGNNVVFNIGDFSCTLTPSFNNSGGH